MCVCVCDYPSIFKKIFKYLYRSLNKYYMALFDFILHYIVPHRSDASLEFKPRIVTRHVSLCHIESRIGVTPGAISQFPCKYIYLALTKSDHRYPLRDPMRKAKRLLVPRRVNRAENGFE